MYFKPIFYKQNLQTTSSNKHGISRFNFILIFVFLFTINGYSQSYWQQTVNYKIDVKLIDSTHSLSGNIKITYTNNSPDTLTYIYMHLWPNAYKNDQTILAKDPSTFDIFSDLNSEDLGYIDSLFFKINNKPAKHISETSIDICKLILNQPLYPQKTIQIETPFFVKIPSGKISRLGHIETSYQITQWHPKPAVYDKTGWHQMPYKNQGEFYSEYGSYEVSISLPKNYTVAATGTLLTQSEIIRQDSIIKNTQYIDFESLLKNTEKNNNTFPKSAKTYKTLHYFADSVHDFAWFADKRFYINKDSVILPHTQKKVFTYAYYTLTECDLWQKANSYINDALFYYSKWLGDYPYKTCTAVQSALSAGGGMEYPMITVIGESYNDYSLENVIMHEVGHNWFYGILGSNERDYPWMDEGLNSFYEKRYNETKYPDSKLYNSIGVSQKLAKLFDIQHYPATSFYEWAYLFQAKRNIDLPANLHSDKYDMGNYGAIVYFKNAFIFNYLMHAIGKNKFDIIMQSYYKKYQFKHPQPSDFFAVFIKNYPDSLSWFFNDILATTKQLDYKILNYNKRKNILTIKNKGQINAPLFIQLYNNDSVILDTTITGFNKKQKISLKKYTHIEKITIDNKRYMPDINRKNNTLCTKKIFKKIEPLRLQLIGSIENPDKTQFFYIPIIGWNNIDKTMPGILLHNITPFRKHFEYQIMPLYSTNTNSLTGKTEVSYFLFPQNKPIQEIEIGINTHSYHYQTKWSSKNRYTRIMPFINILFKNNNTIKKWQHNVSLKHINISKTGKVVFGNNFYINRFTYNIKYNSTLNHLFNVSIEQSDNIVKAFIETKTNIPYKNTDRKLMIRFFGGNFFSKSSNYPIDMRFKSSGFSGYYDYSFDNILLDRHGTKGLFSRQCIELDGGLKTPYQGGNTWLHMAAVNLETSLPINLPLHAFADLVYEKHRVTHFSNMQSTYFTYENNLLYDAGILINFFNGFLKIYCPLIQSKKITDAQNIYANNLFFYRIRFSINFQLANPVHYVRHYSFF